MWKIMPKFEHFWKYTPEIIMYPPFQISEYAHYCFRLIMTGFIIALWTAEITVFANLSEQDPVNILNQWIHNIHISRGVKIPQRELT